MLYKGQRYKVARTHGETFPDAAALVHPDQITLYCNVSIVWAGATPDVVKQRIDEAVLVVRDAYNKKLPAEIKRRTELGIIEVNSTDYQGIVRVTFPLYIGGAPLEADEAADLESALRKAGVALDDSRYLLD